MIRKMLPLLLMMILVLNVGSADAQRRGGAGTTTPTTTPPPPPPPVPEHRFELGGQYGYVWTFERDGVDLHGAVASTACHVPAARVDGELRALAQAPPPEGLDGSLLGIGIVRHR